MQFWLLGALCDILRNYSVNLALDDFAGISNTLFKLILEFPDKVFSLKHYTSKFALLFILLVKAAYPTHLPDAFSQLLYIVSSTQATQDPSLQKNYLSTSYLLCYFSLSCRFYHQRV